MQRTAGIFLKSGLASILVAIGSTAALAQYNDNAPATSPNGATPYAPSYGGGTNPNGGYMPAVSGPPTNPEPAYRPASFPGGAAMPPPANGPSGLPVEAAVAPALPQAKLTEDAQVVGRVGKDTILTSDIMAGVDEMIARGRDRMPPDQVETQRELLTKEVRGGIQQIIEHINDRDPTATLTAERKAIIQQLLRQQIEIKLIYQDFKQTVPKEALPNVEESINKHFEETQLKALLKREKVNTPGELDTALRVKGSSLAREKRIFTEQVISQQWIAKELKIGPEAEEITHEEIRLWYQAHLKEFEKPTRARWEEISVSFSRYPTHAEAYAAMAALGNRVLAGATLADVAKAASQIGRASCRERV